MLFGLDRRNFKILLLKTPTFSELRMSGSKLFHSFIVEGKKEFLKKLCFVRIWEILSEFLVKIWKLMKGLTGKDNLVTCFWLFWISNKVFCINVFVVEIQNLILDGFVPLIAPVIANAALY